MRVGRRILSIQSHVVSGYVGNKAAVFPLELLGFEVDPIHTVQFSNHTGYLGGFRGKRLSGEELDQLVDGLDSNCLLQQVDYVLTGYIGEEDLLRHVAKVIERLRSMKPNLIFLCDPVMGDHGKLYVSSGVVPIYRDQVITLANILTPNQLELSVLSSRSVNTLKEAFQACEYLHEQRQIQHIVVTSGEYTDTCSFTILISSDYGRQRYIQTVDKVEGQFTGAGDLSSALILGWFILLKGDIVAACERAMASVHFVLRNSTATPTAQCPQSELELIANCHCLTHPFTEAVVTKPFDQYENHEK